MKDKTNLDEKEDNLKSVLILKHEVNKDMLSYLLAKVNQASFNSKFVDITDKYASKDLTELKEYEDREKDYSDLIAELENNLLLSNTDNVYNEFKRQLNLYSVKINVAKQEYLKEKQEYYKTNIIILALCCTEIILLVATLAVVLAAIYAPSGMLPDPFTTYIYALTIDVCAVAVLGLAAGIYLFFSNNKNNKKFELDEDDDDNNDNLYKDPLFKNI